MYVVTKHQNKITGFKLLLGLLGIIIWTVVFFVVYYDQIITFLANAKDDTGYLKLKTEPLEPIPDKFDWREKGIVAPVIDQKLCNGCWALCIVGVMETMAAMLRNGNLVQLSVQELLDCSEVNKKCLGGNVKRALDYMNQTTKMRIVNEAEYPLKLIDDQCKHNPFVGVGVGVRNFSSMRYATRDQMTRLLANHGPIIVYVNAAPWLYYLSGVINTGCDSDHRHHAVQVVGYDRGPPIPHYIVRNSWGRNFGEDGYVRVAMGNNVCGIETEVFSLDVVELK